MTKKVIIDESQNVIYEIQTTVSTMDRLIQTCKRLYNNIKKLSLFQNQKISKILYMSKRKVFNFNHISVELTNCEKKNELAKYYATYHRKQWCYKQAYKKDKFKCLSVILASSGIVTAIPIGSISLAGISLSSVLLQMYMKHKCLDKNK